MNPVLPERNPPAATHRLRAWITRLRNKDTVRYFVGKGFLLWPLNVLGVGLGFVSTILYARLLTPEQYGQFAYVMAMMTLLGFLSLQGIYVSVSQAAAQGFDGSMVDGTRARVRFSLLGTVAMTVVGLVCWRSKGPDVAISYFIGAAVFPAFYSFDNGWAILTGKKQFETFAKYRAMQMLTITGATWVALLVTRRVPWVFGANVGLTALTHFIFYHLAVSHFKTNDKVQPDSLNYGKRLSALAVVTSVEVRLDQVVLGTFLPFAALGWFNMASRINEAVMQETWYAIARLLFPRLAECSEQEARRRARVWGAYLVAVFIVLAGLFWVFASWLLPVILGPAYIKSVSLSRWLVLISGFGLAWFIFELYFQARAAEKPMWVARLVLTGTHLALLVLLIRPLGLTGVLISIAAARAAAITTAAIWFRHNQSSRDSGVPRQTGGTFQ